MHKDHVMAIISFVISGFAGFFVTATGTLSDSLGFQLAGIGLIAMAVVGISMVVYKSRKEKQSHKEENDG